MGNLDLRERFALGLSEYGRLFRQGRAHAAIVVARYLYETALEAEDEDMLGLALAKFGSALVNAGRGREAVPFLNDWLTRSTDPRFRYRLSQTLAGHYRSQETADWTAHEHHSGAAYTHAERSGDRLLRSSASHELGIVRLANNDLRMALELFSDSVRLIGNEVPSSRAPFLASLGLSLSCGGDMSKGIYALSHSIGIARGASAPFYELPSRLFLANAMLEMRRPRDAEFHLRIALRLHRIVSTGEQPYPSKILHLLGDALKMQRRSREAFDVFQRLQETFYPDQEGLAEILMDVDARSRITMW